MSYQWAMTFAGLRGPGHLPLIAVQFPSGTLGLNKRVSVRELAEAVEVVAPLPGASLTLPLSLHGTLCQSFSFTGALFERNFSAPLQVMVLGRLAACAVNGTGLEGGSTPLCLVEFDVTAYPIVLSVYPERRTWPPPPVSHPHLTQLPLCSVEFAHPTLSFAAHTHTHTTLPVAAHTHRHTACNV